MEGVNDESYVHAYVLRVGPDLVQRTRLYDVLLQFSGRRCSQPQDGVLID